MSKRLSSPLLALGLVCSLLLAGCQTAVPVAVRPATSFGLGPVGVAEPVVVQTIQTLSGEAEADLPADTMITLATEPTPAIAPPAPVAVAEGPSTASTYSSAAKPVDEEAEVLTAPLPETDDATEAFPVAPVESRETELEAPIPSGAWEFTWQTDEEGIKQETYQLALMADGTVVVEEALEDPEFENAWAGNEIQFAGCGFQFAPQQGFYCPRYQVQVVAPDQLEGTVSVNINHRWIELPVTATRIAE